MTTTTSIEYELPVFSKITDEDSVLLLAICNNDEDRVFHFNPNRYRKEWQKETRSHCHDASYHSEHNPEIIVYPISTEEVSAILSLCNERQIPVTAAGSKTGLEGGSIPKFGGLSLDLSKMNNVVTYHKEDSQVTVQAGIMKETIQAFAEQHDMFFGVDPGSNASLGGYASTGASGTLCTSKYGTMRDNVVRLRVVLPDGKTFWSSQRVTKSSSGYDLNHLFMGSEGTLGIITELTVRLHPKPLKMVGAMAVFNNLHDAAAAVIQIHSHRPSTLARCEILNAVALKNVNLLFRKDFPETPTLFFEFQENEADGCTTVLHAKNIEKICSGTCVNFRFTESDQEREILWEARRGCYFAAYKALALETGMKIKLAVTDVCVPLSRFADVISATENDFKNSKTGLVCSILGHAEDGNFHCMIPFDINDEAMKVELQQLTNNMVHRAILADGTATGEHGVGLGKRSFMTEEHGEVYVDVMHKIKSTMDPRGIMNPGKIFIERASLPKKIQSENCSYPEKPQREQEIVRKNTAFVLLDEVDDQLNGC